LIIERPIGNISEAPFSEAEIDEVSIDWYNTHKRIDRLTSRNGAEIGLRLDAETVKRGLRQGDVLSFDGVTALAADITPCPCIAVRAENTAQLARLCYEVGNRHAPFFCGDDDMSFLLPFDEPMLTMMEKLGIHAKTVSARLLAERRIGSGAGHSHSHGSEQGHSHSHEHMHSHEHIHEHGHEHIHEHSGDKHSEHL